MARATRKSANAICLGVGVDVVDVARLARSMRRTKDFSAGVFTAAERRYGQSRANPSKHFAGAFAAKEAFLKAVGKGLWSGVPLREVEVVRGKSGEPSLRLGASARRAMRKRGASNAVVSLSHEGNAAVAVVLVHG